MPLPTKSAPTTLRHQQRVAELVPAMHSNAIVKVGRCSKATEICEFVARESSRIYGNQYVLLRSLNRFAWTSVKKEVSGASISMPCGFNKYATLVCTSTIAGLS